MIERYSRKTLKIAAWLIAIIGTPIFLWWCLFTLLMYTFAYGAFNDARTLSFILLITLTAICLAITCYLPIFYCHSFQGNWIKEYKKQTIVIWIASFLYSLISLIIKSHIVFI